MKHMPLAPAALSVEGLSKRFGPTQALHDVGFAVPKGAFVALLGAAGAGKTTLLRLIAGLDHPDGGRVVLGGADAGRREPKDRDVAMIFENLALYPNRTGFENIASPLVVRAIASAEIERQVTEVAGTLRIGHVLRRLPRTMSGGERQRVALGRALVRRPQLFLLDEPLASLDAMLRVELRAELRRLQREHGHTFLMATPDFAEALAVADTVVMLRQGSVVQIAGPQELYDAPVDREAARFVGAPEINVVPAQLERSAGRVLVADGSLPVSGELLAALSDAGSAFELGIRPEDLSLADPAAAPIRGVLTDVEVLGLKSAFTIRSGAVELRLVVSAGAARGVAVGQTVGLAVVAQRLIAFDRATGRRLG